MIDTALYGREFTFYKKGVIQVIRRLKRMAMAMALLLGVVGLPFTMNTAQADSQGGPGQSAAFNPPIGRGFNVGQLGNPNEINQMRKLYHANLVRLVINPYLTSTGGTSSNLPLTSAFTANLDRVKLLMSEVAKDGMYAVIDLHNTSAGQVITSSFWNNPNNLNVWISDWQQIITQLAPFRSHIWGYDILNEPTTTNSSGASIASTTYLQWAPQVVAAIRKLDPTTPVIVEATPWDQASSFGNGNVPLIQDPHVIYSLHFYDPGTYTEQGFSVYNKSPITTSWPGEIRYPGPVNGQQWNIQQMQADLQPVISFQQKYHVPIYVGEFGVLRWAPGAAQWMSDATTLFKQLGWSWTYLSLRSDIWGPVMNAQMTSDANAAAAGKAVDPTDRQLVLQAAMQDNTFAPKDNIGSPSSINLALNGNFSLDSNNGGVADGWFAPPSATVTTTNQNGTNVESVTQTQGGLGLASSWLPVAQTHAYRVQLSIQVNQGAVTPYFRNITTYSGYAGSTVLNTVYGTNGQFETLQYTFVPTPGADDLILRFESPSAAQYAVENVQLTDLGAIRKVHGSHTQLLVNGRPASDQTTYTAPVTLQLQGSGIGGEYHIVSPNDVWTETPIGYGENWKWLQMPASGIQLTQPGTYTIGYRMFNESGTLEPADAVNITVVPSS